MKVFLIGAAGGIGRRLCSLLSERGDEVTGMHRGAEQAEIIAEYGATPLQGDLISDYTETLAERIRGHDAVVFSAGAHGTGMNQTTLIDGMGLEKAADAAAEAGVPRFVLVSVFPDAGRDRERREGFEHYMKVKKTADVYLTRTELDWLIIRPGTLVDTPGSGNVTAGPATEYGEVPRDDVAAFIDASLQEPNLTRTIVELTAGDTPAARAVTSLAT